MKSLERGATIDADNGGSNSHVHDVRRTNLSALVLDRYRGNKAALARATGVHPNHINLLLSLNREHRRNLGETLARKIEEALGLPRLWLDTPRDKAQQPSAFTSIRASAVGAELAGALRTCERFEAISIAAESVKSGVTAVENLQLAAIDTHDMEPSLPAGETVMVDNAVRAVSGDGVYVVTRANMDSAMLRRFKRDLAGSLTWSIGQGAPEPVPPQLLRQLKVCGRVVSRIHVERVV